MHYSSLALDIDLHGLQLLLTGINFYDIPLASVKMKQFPLAFLS